MTAESYVPDAFTSGNQLVLDASDQPTDGAQNHQASGRAVVEFCGVETEVTGTSFTIGRRGDLPIGEENCFVHRYFLQLRREHGRWFLTNIGSGLSATVGGVGASHHAILGPGASLALNQSVNRIRFSAGPTRYELEIRVPARSCGQVLRSQFVDTGERTMGRMPLTRDQHLLIVALSEVVLREGTPAATSIPTSQATAQRLGWTITKFNRKLDNVCQKLQRVGVQGVHGGVGALASNRRIRLVEHALAAGLVCADDLALLDRSTPNGKV